MFGLKLNKIFFLALILVLPCFAKAKTLTYQDQTWEVPAQITDSVPANFVRNDFDLKTVAINSLTGSHIDQTQKILDEQTLQQLALISPIVDQPAQDPKLIIENNKVTEFTAPAVGQAVDLYQLYKLLLSDKTSFDIPLATWQPKISLSETNNLGINELISEGVSNFTGSPNNRIHNINVGATKFNGIIVAKGEEFSFNNYLGPVDGEHGFLPELVIKPQGVTPEFGGGLCQVSTTTFRAAMIAGLPITARRNHSFAVQYYAPQGTDATIYPGSSDLKFINNTPAVILIHTKIIGKKLYFDFYGTKDDRTVAFDGPVQYDKKPDGSMKATWTRHVTLNGQTTDQTFNSNYLSPALFHHDTTPPAATPPITPTTTPTPPLTQTQ